MASVTKREIQELLSEDEEDVFLNKRLKQRNWSMRDEEQSKQKVAPKKIQNSTSKENKVSPKKVLTRKKKEESCSDENSDETEVEELRKRNIQAKMEMLKKLKLFDMKQEMETSRKKKLEKLRAKRLEKANSLPTEPERRSTRLQSQKPLKNIAENYTRNYPSTRSASSQIFESAADCKYNWATGQWTKVLQLKDALDLDYDDLKGAKELLLEMPLTTKMSSEEEEAVSAFKNCSLDDFKEKIDSLTLTKQQIMKDLPKSGVTALAFSPSVSSVVVAAGCKTGTIALWKVEPDMDMYDYFKVVMFDYHTKPTDCISFAEERPHLMYTCSTDGTFIEADFEKQNFTTLYNIESPVKSCWHVQIQQNIFLLGIGNGKIAKIDVRENSTKCTRFRCYDGYSIRTISKHPKTDFNFATATERYKEVAIWDLRMMKDKLSAVVLPCSPSSAFFSPITGNTLLVTCDKQISTIDTSDLQDPKLQFTISSNDHCYRSKAIWHPQREDVVVIDSRHQPRIQLYRAAGCNLEPLTHLANEELVKFHQSAVVEFHPNLPAVAIGNGIGDVSVFI